MAGNDSIEDSGTAIAVIGMACRFPGAESCEQFWQNLQNGVESISFFSNQELRSAGVSDKLLGSSKYVKARGILKNVDLFDASFFNFSPREAEILDPQHRFFLECAWQALEIAGYDTERYAGLIGVYAGSSFSQYLLNLYSNPPIVDSVGGFQIMVANDKDHLVTRAAYKLNLRGPSVAVQTACSTSLVAVHLACQALLSGDCDIALAGGVSITIPEVSGYFYHEGGILSPDGHCRAFDTNAQGTVNGNGIGIVVLKCLEDALNDGDHIEAVILGSAVTNDGALRLGYTAPGVDGQANVIAAAQAIAGVSPNTIDYIETHGTGTPLGDSVECAALAQAFGSRSQASGKCAIGSVKTNIGHLDASAGVAGFIKTVLALKHKAIPPSLHFSRPGREVNFDGSPFYVNTQLTPWRSAKVRRAAVSSFGLGGTNAHVVLQSAPEIASTSSRRDWHLLLLSAKTSTGLEKMLSNLGVFVERHSEHNLADVAFTLATGRRRFAHRCMLVCRQPHDATAALQGRDLGRLCMSDLD
ncbi:MAG: polyketide synthase, partial [Acidobacteria bacterium]